MNNKELLKRLNENSKKFMDDFFSFYAFFVNQTKEDNFLPRQIDEETMEEINHKMLEYQALFLSMLKNDDISSKFYNKYGITYDNFKEKLKDYDFDDLEFIKAENCDEIDDGYLRLLFVRISLTVEYTCYLEKEKINYDTLQPFQLFDSLFGDAEIAFEDGLKDLYNIDDDLFKNYKDYIHDYYSDFAQLYFGINIDEEREKELNNYTVYDYDTVRIEADNNSAYITFKENVDLEKLINHVNRDYKSDDNRDLKSSERKEDFIKTLKLPAKFAIEELKHNDKVDVSVIEKDLLNDDFQRIPIKLRNLENNKTCTIWIYKYEAFTSESDKIINTILNKHYDDNIRPYNVNNDIFPAPLQNTPNLDIYGLDLTRNQFVKDPSIGRDEEIKRIEQILCYPERDKSVIITGVAGCGKTALVQGLAYRIQNGNVPDALKNLRIISIDVSSLVSGCRYVGMLEERMRNILEEAAQSKDIVLFIDEIHQALGAGKSDTILSSTSSTFNPDFAEIHGASCAGIPIISSISFLISSGLAFGRSILFKTGNISKLLSNAKYTFASV